MGINSGHSALWSTSWCCGPLTTHPADVIKYLNVSVVGWANYYQLYVDRVLTQLRAQGITVNDQDVERLSPLDSTRFNFLGRYHFALPEAIAHGGFRPLRDLTAAEAPAIWSSSRLQQ